MTIDLRKALLAALLGSAIGLSGTAALAQATGHDDGGHTDGGHTDGGHEDGAGGSGGNGNGPSYHGGEDPAVPDALATAGSDRTLPRAASGLPTPGTYARLSLGAGLPSLGDAFWHPPGYPSDPEVHFDLSADTGIAGTVAIGRTFKQNWRGELALTLFGEQAFSGDWSYTVPDTAGPHAAVSGAIRSVAVMANGYYDLDATGAVRPYLSAGIGAANNTMSDWTRINPDSGRTTRTFAGASHGGLAWSVGVGATIDMSDRFGRPAMLDVSYRYFDLGQAMGSATPLPGSGAGGEPVTPLTIDVRQSVIGVGLVFPF